MSIIKLKQTNSSLLGQRLLFVFSFRVINLPGIIFSEKNIHHYFSRINVFKTLLGFFQKRNFSEIAISIFVKLIPKSKNV